MKTKHISVEEMDKRISKFRKLKPLSIQQDANIPIEGRDVVYARQLLSVIGLDPTEGNTPINSGAPIIGAGGITFTVLDGQFEISWNDDGSDTIILEKFDTISVPPGVCRSFKNSGKTDGLLQVIISGGVHDMNDIAFTPAAADKINSVEPGLVDKFTQVGFKFNAGINTE